MLVLTQQVQWALQIFMSAQLPGETILLGYLEQQSPAIQVLSSLKHQETD
jgi:hypothetical protein